MRKIFNLSEKSGLTYGRGYVHFLQYHIVWCTKNRKKVLCGNICDCCRQILLRLSQEYNFTIITMEVAPDYIHIFIDCRPQLYIPDMVKILKGNMARWIFIGYPEIKDGLCGKHLWNPSYCVVSASDKSAEQIAEYLFSQKERA